MIFSERVGHSVMTDHSDFDSNPDCFMDPGAASVYIQSIY